MASSYFFPLSFFFSLIISTTTQAKQTYIVHMKHTTNPSTFATCLNSITTTKTKTITNDPLLYTYSQAYHGFAASLDPQEADLLRQSDDVIGVYQDKVYQIHTTRSPEFMGLQNELGLWDGQDDDNGHKFVEGHKQDVAYDVIVGVIDTGIWPESNSFVDTGMHDIPSRWRGICESGPDFHPNLCNKKLVGARSFSKGHMMASSGSDSQKKKEELVSPRDHKGHGTHIASTIVGAKVENSSLFGYASGIARGMVTHARVASYKVCWSIGCFGADILAAMEQAILDGVDVLSLSLGGEPRPYDEDPVAIGAFGAISRGIFVSCSAGNSGPTKSSLSNVAPWIMTVGAGTIDRDFPAYVLLGNGKRVNGVSIYEGRGMGRKKFGLVYNKGNKTNLCIPGTLDPTLVKGKIVVCDRGSNTRVDKGRIVRDAGGVGMIIVNTPSNGEELVVDSHLLPAVAVGRKNGDLIKEYIESNLKPSALLRFKGTVLNIRPSPVVAAFSSRGPNKVTPQILKPDVIGPGVNILAAWSEAIGPSSLKVDPRRTQFNILSGTSMSCPHISGVAALMKAEHPTWSPSAIKSALMTTAYTFDNTQSPLHDAVDGSLSNPWAHGAGHVEPQKALLPGLVYDISTDEYITFLCSLGYAIEKVQAITMRPNITCKNKFVDLGELNYPSFSVVFGNKKSVRYIRTLTNVGVSRVSYNVNVTAPPSVKVVVRPTRLTFRSVGEKKRYKVTFVIKNGTSPSAKSEFGSIAWSNSKTKVVSPIVFVWS